MNIAVIAASGRTGKEFVEQALNAGHTVHAGVHTRNNLPDHPRLTAMLCDATSQSELAALVEHQDAVVSFIGHSKGSPKHVQANAMRALVSVTKAHGPRRVVSLTGTGVRFSGDCITFMDRVLNTSIRIIDPARVYDGIEHVQVLKQSTLDWTVVRVLKLQNTKQQPFTLRVHGPTKLFVSRKDVAAAVLEVLERHSFIHEAPILSKP